MSDYRHAYSEKLRDPRWQKMRLYIMERDDFKCRRCGDKRTTLNVHHLSYRRKAEPWQYPSWMLITLCEPCHQRETELKRTNDADLIRAATEKLLVDEIGELADLLDMINDLPKFILDHIDAHLSEEERRYPGIREASTYPVDQESEPTEAV